MHICPDEILALYNALSVPPSVYAEYVRVKFFGQGRVPNALIETGMASSAEDPVKKRIRPALAPLSESSGDRRGETR